MRDLRKTSSVGRGEGVVASAEEMVIISLDTADGGVIGGD